MNAGYSMNGYGALNNMNLPISDRRHINPMLEALVPASRQAQLQILNYQSRRASVASDASSVMSEDSISKIKAANRSSKQSFAKKLFKKH